MRESKVRKALHDRIAALGGEYRAAKWIGARHCPDDFVMLDGRHIWVEGKRPGKTAREGQAREHERMRAAGCEVLVINTVALVDLHFPLN